MKKNREEENLKNNKKGGQIAGEKQILGKSVDNQQKIHKN